MSHHEDPPGAARDEPMGVVLAGGAGRRIGGSKALVELDHRPLISYPLEAMWEALGNVTIVAKADTELPSIPGATVWIEPQEPRHPLTGLVHALSLADGRPVMVCASDMPLIAAEEITAIAHADPAGAAAVVASLNGEIEPLLGCYQPSALGPLTAAASGDSGIGLRDAPLTAAATDDSGIRLRDAVAALNPQRFEIADPDCLFNVNSPDDLLQAAAILDLRRASRT